MEYQHEFLQKKILFREMFIQARESLNEVGIYLVYTTKTALKIKRFYLNLYGTKIISR